MVEVVNGRMGKGRLMRGESGGVGDDLGKLGIMEEVGVVGRVVEGENRGIVVVRVIEGLFNMKEKKGWGMEGNSL